MVEGLEGGSIYRYKVYQNVIDAYEGSNPMSVDGESKGSPTQGPSDEATAEGEATATTDGKITFTFTRSQDMVVLSGLAIGLDRARISCAFDDLVLPTAASATGPNCTEGGTIHSGAGCDVSKVDHICSDAAQCDANGNWISPSCVPWSELHLAVHCAMPVHCAVSA